jgi:thiamine-phosphate pyrophosphorylase
VLCDADGVHVGQDELSVKEARTILGPRRLVGVSTHSLEQARQAVLDGADYIGCGPTFASGTKSFSQFPGLAFLREVAADICVPAFAIGGISIANVGQVMAAGLYRIAVSGAAMTAEHPGEVVKALKAKLPPLTSSPPAIS